MEPFSEEHSKLLLSKEWLAKSGTRNSASTPYLFKFWASTSHISCVLLITDTKSVWAEVLDSNKFARRWRACNSIESDPSVPEEDEEEWRVQALKTLSNAHTLGGVADFTFEVVDSLYADLGFELECEYFKWRWETCSVGCKLGPEIISQHLLLPLITMSHISFASTDAMGEIPEPELEKVIDKTGRVARRTIDTHIKNTISKPRLATSLRRMTAMLNFLPEPSVVSAAETPNLEPPSPPVPPKRTYARVPTPKRSPSPSKVPSQQRAKTVTRTSPSPSPPPARRKSPEAEPKNEGPPPPSEDLSETESEDDEELNNGKGKAPEVPSNLKEPERGLPPPSSISRSRSRSPGPSTSTKASSTRKTSPDTDSSPAPPPAKKKKTAIATSDSDDSDDENSRRPAPAKTGRNLAGAKRGTRQPIKRGGKRF